MIETRQAKKNKFVAILHRNIPLEQRKNDFEWYEIDRKSRIRAGKLLYDAEGFIKSHNGRVRKDEYLVSVIFKSKEASILFKLIYG